MSDSTIDDAIRLLEIGKGNSERLKNIIESFETRSLIRLEDRKYVEALVQQYLTPRHRITIKKIEPIRKQQSNFPKTKKSTKPEFQFKKEDIDSDVKITSDKIDLHSIKKRICDECGNENSDKNNFCNNCGKRLSGTAKLDNTSDTTTNEVKQETAFQKYEREYLKRQTQTKSDENTIEEKFIEYIEAKPTKDKKSNKKFVGIGIGIVAIIIIAGGAALMADNTGFTAETENVDRATCDNKPLLVSTTKIPGFPNPEKDLQYYLDRYNNEPNYKDWFDRNFPGQTIQEVLVVPSSDFNKSKIPGFPNPEKDLQYYLDRYNNEPNYKDWFDRNFPGQTIQEVVC